MMCSGERRTGGGAVHCRDDKEGWYAVHDDDITTGPVNASDLARKLGISIALARQQLQETEQLGLLCRDEGLADIMFYTNFILGL